MTQTLTPTQKHTHGLLSVDCCPLTFKKKHTHGLLSVVRCLLSLNKQNEKTLQTTNHLPPDDSGR